MQFDRLVCSALACLISYCSGPFWTIGRRGRRYRRGGDPLRGYGGRHL